MKFKHENIKDAYKFLVKLDEQNKDVELKAINKKRTVKQNSYLHVCITLFAIEFGYTLDEAKVMLKRKCNFMVYEKNKIKFLRRTRDLQTDELTKFIDWFRTYSANNGCYIPTAEEYLTNKISIDNEIERNKEFL